MQPRIQKVLIANRGEIAIRILRAAAELRIPTVSVYTREDRFSPHRYKADEAYQIGADDEPLKPYLDIETILEVALKHGVDAIHPGYGFLSENVDFARRCEEVGVIFIGPPPEVMDLLGNKVSAKKAALAAGLPIIESSREPLDSYEIALQEARRVGFPLMLKAVSGGGGRGMRVLFEEGELEKAYHEARSEALKAFGDDTMFLEKFVASPKHIEVQILGDEYGNIVHLYERDCSIQRRFQKVVEVAPSSGLSPETRQQLLDYALQIMRHVGYVNAGTVEFLVDRNEKIYFIEVNPRVQVEHTITEEITGIDIVRSQLHIAGGHRLDDPEIGISSQDDISCRGYAVQCRITTEDPTRDFQPDFGRLIAYRSAGGFGIRLDVGAAYPGALVSPFFDSLLVKVTAWGRTLEGAVQRSNRALREFRVRGVSTNIGFLENVLEHPEFYSGRATVDFVGEHPELFKISPSFDRATKMLLYLADITVNGHPDVKKVERNKKFRVPAIPDYRKLQGYPSGTRNRLDEMGADKFCQWIKEQKNIYYTDTTFRDAHQSLLATRVRTLDMVKVAEGMAKNHFQLFSLEMWGGATFDVALRFLHECPWERLRMLREAIPNILFQMLFRGANAVGYKAYPDNLIEKFIVRAWENGIDVFRIFDSLNWIEGMKKSIHAVRKHTGGIAEATICYTGDVLREEKGYRYNLQYYLDLARRLEDEGAHILCVKDMAGLLKPYAAAKLIPALKATVDIPIHLHTHDTAAIQAATLMKAIEADVDIVDAAIASMSGLTSQPNLNSIVAMMQGHEREQSINLQSLNEYSNYWEDVREFYYPFESGLKAGTAEVYDHEIPGGQYSNLRPQAVALGLEHKFEEIKKNYAVVNRMLGDIVKVTPSSKVVGDMALYMTSNDLTEEDIMSGDQAISFPDSVIDLFKGKLGQVGNGGFPEKLSKIVLKGDKPMKGRPNDELEPVDFEGEFAQFQEEFDEYQTELDFLSYKMYPQVFRQYYENRKKYGDLRYLPTTTFYYGLKQNEEVLVKLDKGKSIVAKLLYRSEPDEAGICRVTFDLNGQVRSVEVRDHSAISTVKANAKAIEPHHVGSPLQGKLSAIQVEAGKKVRKDEPLFVIEAMKMETTVSAPYHGVIEKIHLEAGTLVDQDDLVVEFRT